MTQEQKNIICSLRYAGEGYLTIARKVGLAKSTIATFCQRNGLGKGMEQRPVIVPQPKQNPGGRKKGFKPVERPGIACRVNYEFQESPDSTVIARALQILNPKR